MIGGMIFANDFTENKYVILQDSAIDTASWDRFVAGHPNGHLLQSSGWGALKFALWLALPARGPAG